MTKNVRVFIDDKKITGKVLEAWERIQTPMTEIMLADSNYFARQDTGALISSSYLHSVPESGLLVWNTPYAARVYYTGTPSKDVNPMASLRWVEVAENYFLDQWAKQAEALLLRMG